MSDRPSLAEAATAYAEAGWHVFPCVPRGKVPVGGSGYLDATTDAERVGAWWRREPEANIGCWPGPGGVIVFDLDGPAGYVAAERFGLLDVVTLTCRTGRADGGEHRYFRHPGGEVRNPSLAEKLDVRADRGYVLLPPSVHPSGARYTFDDPDAEIAELPVAALIEIRRRQNEAARLAADARQALARLHAGPRGADLARRVRGYLARVPRGVAEGGRNNVAYRLAAFLTHDFALRDDEALAWLATWDAENVPPLPARELEKVLESAKKHGSRPVGGGLQRQRAS